jgi:hypothetical protein
LLAVIVAPACGEPEMLGAVVGVGAALLETTAEGADAAEPDPPLFVAVTVTRRVWPTSVVAAVYVAFVAPPIAEHEAPFASHRLQA